jgi:ribosome-associated toxin RatA of RatAB toxin-antitoxin module
MILANEVTIQAPIYETFSVASDLERWPNFLSHYRYNKFLSKMPWGGIVKMACNRSGINTSWVSVYRIIPEEQQMHFEHVRSFMNATRGMKVVWQFTEVAGGGVHIRITHDHVLNWPVIGGVVNHLLVGRFFVHNIANKTLAGLKRHMESPAG